MQNSNLWRGLHDPETTEEKADFLILGIPFDEGCSFRQGTKEGPDYLRKGSDRNPPFTEDGIKLSAKIHDSGDIIYYSTSETQAQYFDRVQAKAETIFHTSAKDNTGFPFFIGGDHSVTIPILKAANEVYNEEQDIAIIHLDSHLDVCDTIDGNPLSHGSTHRRSWELDSFSPKNTYFLGIRCSEQQEHEFLSDKSTNIVTAKEMYKKTPVSVAKQVVEKIGDIPVYLTFDIDVLDPAYAPGTGTPVSGGISTREALIMLEQFSKLSLIGMDLVEVSPRWDNSEITLYSANKILFEMMGFITSKPKQIQQLSDLEV